MARAAAFIREAGGAEQSRVFTRMWLSLIGLWSWQEVPTLPPEQILLPPRAPLSVYSFGCWARQTIVALSVVTALEPSRAGRLRDRRAALGRPLPVGRVGSLGQGLRPRRPCGPRLCPPAGRPAAKAGSEDRRALDRRAAGARRLLGRDPAAVGLVDRRAACARLPPRPPGSRSGDRRPRQLHDRGRRGPPPRGLPVARLGHRAVGARAARRRRRSRTTRRSSAHANGCRRRRSGRAATGRCAGPSSRRAASRSSSRTRTTPTSTTRP